MVWTHISFKVLNELGAGIHKKVEGNGESLLHLVARRDRPEFIELLVSQFRIEVDVRSRKLYTPLHEAVRSWSFESVKKLVELGADIYAISEEERFLGYRYGISPLSLARKSGHAGIKRFLMQVHQQHKEEGSARALGYEAFDSGKNNFNRVSTSFINQLSKLIEKICFTKIIIIDLDSRTQHNT